MSIKMEKYSFNGDWSFRLKLTEFAKLTSSEWNLSDWKSFDRDEVHLQNLKEGFVPFEIIDERNYEPDPTPAQERTIEYLINHQNQVLPHLFEHFNHTINKHYAEACGETDWILEMASYEDLGKVIGLNEITILTEEKDGYAYWQMDCLYKGDEEHALAVVMHQDRLIEYTGIGDLAYFGVYKDLGMEEDKIFEVMLTEREFGKDMVHQVLPRHEKFKPWQLHATEEYFSTLFRGNKTEKLIEEIEHHNWDMNLRFPRYSNKNLVDWAAYYNNPKMLIYLIAKGGDYSQAMLQCTNYDIQKEAVKCLVKHGATVDVFGDWKRTALYNALEGYIRDLKYQNSSERASQYKENIQFLLSQGANPFHLNEKGEDYKMLLEKELNRDYHPEDRLIWQEIEKMIESSTSIRK